MDIALVVIGLIIFIFAFVIAFGAPYLPTLEPQITAAFDLLDLKPGETLIELGSGDGRVLIAAAERGLNAVGYELNPLLAGFSWLRTRKYKQQVRVVCGNFWQKKLPQAEAIFVFLLDRYMDKLDQKIKKESPNPVKLVSYAFKVPGRKPIQRHKGLFLYQY